MTRDLRGWLFGLKNAEQAMRPACLDLDRGDDSKHCKLSGGNRHISLSFPGKSHVKSYTMAQMGSVSTPRLTRSMMGSCHLQSTDINFERDNANAAVFEVLGV